MSRLHVAPIVEGQGEVASIRILLERTWELVGGEYVRVDPPFREGRGRIVKKDILQRAVRSASLKLNTPAPSGDPALVLILIDADDDRPCVLGPELLAMAREANPAIDVACVLAVVEYETWIAAAAESLTQYLDLPAGFTASETPEASRHGKAWIKRHFRGGSYSETQDQPGMTAAMDLSLCRRRSASFDKLCRELEQRLQPQTPAA
jgi:hypothetical protein